MNIFTTTMNFISALLSVYMILIIIRVFLTWFRGNFHSKATDILISVVDPYLNIFRKITWLRVGSFDFSPIVAMMVLGLFVQITSSIAQTGHFTVGMLLAYIISGLWSFVAFILTILILMMVVRFISLFFRRSNSQIWFIMDNILNRVMSRILGLFSSKAMPFRQALVVCGLILLVVRVGLQFAVVYLMHMISNL